MFSTLPDDSAPSTTINNITNTNDNNEKPKTLQDIIDEQVEKEQNEFLPKKPDEDQ